MYVAAGRICAAYPVTQIVMLIVAWVTSEFVAPGVQPRSGRPFALAQGVDGGDVLAGGGTTAAAIVGVGDGRVETAVAPAPPQAAAKATTRRTIPPRNRGIRPTIPRQDYRHTSGSSRDLAPSRAEAPPTPWCGASHYLR